MERLTDRVAVVTGGANGIGLGLARRFLAEGMKVVIADVNAADLDRAVDQLGGGRKLIGHRTDVSDARQVQDLADKAVEHFGAVHILCNNAGVGGAQRFENTSLATWDWTIGVDLWGPIHGCRAFLPILERQDEAHIVNTASMAGFVYVPYHIPYCVAKAGLVALTEALWREFALEKPHIGVSVVCPGATRTTISRDERNAPAGHTARAATDPDLEGLRDFTSTAQEAGISPDVLADCVIDGIRKRDLYIFPQPEWLALIEERTTGILTGRHNPDFVSLDAMAGSPT